MKPLLTALLLVLLGAPAAFAADLGYPLDAPAPDGRRPGGTLAESRPAPPLAAEENKDLKRERNYPSSRRPFPTASSAIASTRTATSACPATAAPTAREPRR
ncbi:cytochrome c-type protein NapB precursor [Pseudomonas aeruginosa]|nr:cytochrome c-type protein NapB precursor [Pseudomonas aeruginosa]